VRRNATSQCHHDRSLKLWRLEAITTTVIVRQTRRFIISNAKTATRFRIRLENAV
jgi:hypothetical protein